MQIAVLARGNVLAMVLKCASTWGESTSAGIPQNQAFKRSEWFACMANPKPKNE